MDGDEKVKLKKERILVYKKKKKRRYVRVIKRQYVFF